jgi:glycosyltransferase involved in cell wall biosynthesis
VLDRLIHFLQTGLARGDAIGPLFDADFYTKAAQRAGLAGVGAMSALQHYLLRGHAAQIVPTPLFDTSAYLAFNPDLAGLATWPFEHFIRHGLYEGRPFSKLPMARVAAPSGTAAQPAARLRLMLSAGRIPAGLSAADAERVGWLAASQTRLREVMASDALRETMAQAVALEPAVGEIDDISIFMLPPFFNPMAEPHRAMKARLKHLHYDTIVTVPWIRNGGADLVAGLFLQALQRTRPAERVLLLRVDQPHFDRPDWIPGGIDVTDISDIMADIPEMMAEQLLYTFFAGIAPRRVVNINSRLAWQCLRRFGERLSGHMKLYGYLFCWDQTTSGRRVGYPSDFFPSTAPFLTGVFTDTQYLKDELARMYQLPRALADRMTPLRSPARLAACSPTMAERGAASAADRVRPLVLWGGRLDYQKRFDIVVAVARLMPHVHFRCWGQAMLDAPPDLSTLPPNIAMQGGFKALTDLPLADCDGWLFTSAWEGMPTTVIELATLGMPMVCSSVGGVPDLIDETTGWLVPADADVAAYVAAVEEMVRTPALRARRGMAAQARAKAMFAPHIYDATLAACLNRETVEAVT